MSNCMYQGAGVLIFPCSGGSDVCELSDRAARKIAKCGQARMFCLAGIGAHIPWMIESANAANKISGGKSEETISGNFGGCCGN